jgi:hypothetical protein
MGWARLVDRKANIRIDSNIWSENLNGRNLLENLDIDGSKRSKNVDALLN